MNGLAWLYLRQGKYANAERWLREALAGYANSAPEIWQRYACQSMLGATVAGQKRYAEAEPLLITSDQGLLQRQATIPAFARAFESAGSRIVQLYKDWGRPAQAAEWRERLRTDNLALATTVRR